MYQFIIKPKQLSFGPLSIHSAILSKKIIWANFKPLLWYNFQEKMRKIPHIAKDLIWGQFWSPLAQKPYFS